MSTIRFSSFPRTLPPPPFTEDVVNVFRRNEAAIATLVVDHALTSNDVLRTLRDELVALGFEVESGKRKSEKIVRPVFFGEGGKPTLRYEIDAYNPLRECGLEIEAGRAWMGNAVYRDLVLACVIVQVKYLILAVPNTYKYRISGRPVASQDYDRTVALAEALYGHTRIRLPYNLILVGY